MQVSYNFYKIYCTRADAYAHSVTHVYTVHTHAPEHTHRHIYTLCLIVSLNSWIESMYMYHTILCLSINLLFQEWYFM